MSGLPSNIEVPPVGTHVEITGSYALDKEHGGWAEIHHNLIYDNTMTNIRKYSIHIVAA